MALAVLTGLDQIVGDGTHYIVASDMLANLTSLRDAANLIDTAQFNGRVVGSTEIKLGNIVTNLLATGVLSADTTGRAKMADGFLTTAKLADGVLSADSTGLAKMADGFLTFVKTAVGSGMAEVKTGTYSGNGGSGDNDVVVATGHETDLLIMAHSTLGRVYLAMPIISDPGDVWFLWGDGPAIPAAMAAAIQQNSDGFTILSGKGASYMNVNATTFNYISIALA